MKRKNIAIVLSAMLLCWSAVAAELPAGFPSDIPVADFMTVFSSTQVRDDMNVSFHAPGQTMDGVAEWLIAAMTGAGWNHSDDSALPNSRILVFVKGDRRCGMMVTNSVMNESMQMDNTIKGIQMQISGGSDSGDEGAAVSSSMEATAEGAQENQD